MLTCAKILILFNHFILEIIFSILLLLLLLLLLFTFASCIWILHRPLEVNQSFITK
jgi:hypothetical protein